MKAGWATTGKSFLVIEPPDSVFASYLIRLRLVDHNVLPEFVSYFFQSPVYWNFVDEGIVGSTQGGFNASKLSALTIPVPSIAEQQRIVSILDKAFEGIATAKANAEKNLQNARELFESYLENVFTERGDGWELKKVSELATHSLGKMLDKTKNRGTPKPYLRNLNVRWFGFDLSDIAQMRFLPEEFEKYSAMKGDVLICEGGYPGRTAIWGEDYSIFFQKAIHRVRFHQRLHGRLFQYYIYSQDRSGQLKRYFTGTGIQHFTGKTLAEFRLPIPPQRHLHGILDKFEQISVQTKNLELFYQKKTEALQELEKSILHQAFHGQL